MNNKTIINPQGRIICIGDLHGCIDEAYELLELCKPTSKDIIIFLGDLVDRGPENAKCVDLAMKHECILGNHEDRHLYYKNLEAQGKDPQVVVPNHIATRHQLKPHHYDYFRSLPFYIKLPEYNSIVVHAGVYPNRPIEAQDLTHLLHIQMINPPEKTSKWPSKAPEDWKFWTHYWQGPETIIFGHTVLNKPLITEKVVGIDGGAVFGKELWAYELPSKQIYKVKGKANYGNGSRGRSGQPIAAYLIHDDVKTYS